MNADSASSKVAKAPSATAAAMVTGAGSGIGRACVEHFVAEGSRVACIDRDEGSLDELRTSLGDSVVTIPCDVAQEPEVAVAADLARAELGTIGKAALCAGVYLSDKDSAVDELELSTWQKTLDVNLTGMFLTAREAVRSMLESGGSVVLIGSPTGFLGMELGMHAYSASKGGVLGMVRVMANEYAQRGIRVNLVVPGFIRTGLNEPFFANNDLIDQVIGTIPMRRPGEPHEVASLVSWLCSDGASYATGGIYTVDGGITAV